MGNARFLRVAYYYGRYLEDAEDNKSIVMGVYSADGRDGFLFHSKSDKSVYVIDNLPNLKKSPMRWRVGEINGGLWSYTRLYYLAQEVGSRPRQLISVKTIQAHPPTQCYVMGFEQEASDFDKHQ